MELTIDAKDRSVARRVRRLVYNRLGEDAALVLTEALDNAYQHTDGMARVTLHAKRFSVFTPHKIRGLKTQKTDEWGGGYGLVIMRSLGGEVHALPNGLLISYDKGDE